MLQVGACGERDGACNECSAPGGGGGHLVLHTAVLVQWRTLGPILPAGRSR